MLGAWLGHADSADAEHRLAITVSGVCPSREAVMVAIADVLVDAKILAGEAGPALGVVVNDDGVSYRVEAGGASRTFVDALIRCDERARKVAVVVALALEPPVVEIAAAHAVAPAISVAVVLAAPDTAPGMQIETGGIVETAPGTGNDRINKGIDLRLGLGRSNPRFVIGAELVEPMMLDVVGGRARVQRVPIDLALRSRLGGDRLAAMLELGPRFVVQSTDGVDVMSSVHAVRLEVGARIAAGLEAWPSRSYGTYLQVQGDYVPRPSRFTLPNMGVVGEMPSLWVGASLGVMIRVR